MKKVQPIFQIHYFISGKKHVHDFECPKEALKILKALNMDLPEDLEPAYLTISFREANERA
jgi:hypothetical protein